MRRLSFIILSLAILAHGAGTLRAQSGRNRSVPTESSADAAKPSATGQSGVDAPAASATDAQAEVVEGDVVSVNTSLTNSRRERAAASTAATPSSTSRRRSRGWPKSCAASTALATTRSLRRAAASVVKSKSRSVNPTSSCRRETATSTRRRNLKRETRARSRRT